MEGIKISNRVIPDDERNCIWVDAGLLSYKLCDRKFECDECPLDEALRRHQGYKGEEIRTSRTDNIHSADPPVTPPGRSLESLVSDFTFAPVPYTLPVDRLYSRNHLWAMRIENNLYRLGFDQFVARLVEISDEFVVAQPETNITVNDPCAWVLCENLTVAVRSPLSGRIRKTNLLLNGSAAKLGEDFYGAGWICEVTVDEKTDPTKRLFTGAEMSQSSTGQFIDFRRELLHDLESSVPPIGITLADGGMRPNNLRDLVGPQKYIAFLRKILSIKL